MNIFVVNEAQKGRQFSTEKRCALTPASAKKLIRLGYTVTLETNAGKAAGFSDSDFTEVDVNVTKDREIALQKRTSSCMSIVQCQKKSRKSKLVRL